MKSNELRIGNLLQKLDGSVFNISIEDILVIAEWKGNEGLLPKPIPLTVEWLLKLGFIPCESPYNDKLAWVIGEDANRLIWCENNLFKSITDGFVRITHDEYPISGYACEFVHQLQNACSILRGRELNYKP